MVSANGSPPFKPPPLKKGKSAPYAINKRHTFEKGGGNQGGRRISEQAITRIGSSRKNGKTTPPPFIRAKSCRVTRDEVLMGRTQTPENPAERNAIEGIPPKIRRKQGSSRNVKDSASDESKRRSSKSTKPKKLRDGAGKILDLEKESEVSLDCIF